MTRLPLVRCARVQSCLLTEKSCGQRWLNATPLEAEDQYVEHHLRVCIGCDDGKSRAHLGIRHEPRTKEEDWLHRDMARRAEWSNVSHLLKALHELTGELLVPHYDPKQAIRDNDAAALGMLQLREWQTASDTRRRFEIQTEERRRDREQQRAWEAGRPAREEATRQAEAERLRAPRYKIPEKPLIGTLLSGSRRFFSDYVSSLHGFISVDVVWDLRGYWRCDLKIPGQKPETLFARPELLGGDPMSEEGCLIAVHAIFNQSAATPLVPRDEHGRAKVLANQKARQTSTD